MKRKIIFLITGCIFTVVALAVIQSYFIYNTYQLESKEAKAAITGQFLKLETDGKLDSINAAWMKKTEEFIGMYARGRIEKDRYVHFIKRTSDSLSNVVLTYLSRKGIFEEYEVNYTNYIVLAALKDKKGRITDTIFKGKQLLYGNNDQKLPETQASQSTWRGNTDQLLCRDANECPYFEVITERYYSIANWERQVFIKMSGLLAFSVGLLAFVVFLFYMSIKNLITQKKIAEIKTDFINNITHEFQTPLAALDIAVITLRNKDTELTPEQYATTLSIIERQNVRIQKLFRQVTDASLTDGAITADSMQGTTWAEVCHIIDDFSLSHPAATLSCTADDPVTILPIDRFHLSTVMVNLLDNAIKYGADTISVTLGKTVDTMSITVQDNGIGIPKKEHRAIFEKFYRVEKGNIHTAKGLGLGLFYVRRVIEAYRGSISVSSETGKGATFTILLPNS